jgi:uncharacterized membrane protein
MECNYGEVILDIIIIIIIIIITIFIVIFIIMKKISDLSVPWLFDEAYRAPSVLRQ